MDMTWTPVGLRAGSTPSGPSARRAPDTPSIRASDGPFRSASAAPTASPRAASAAARLAVTALFPTPPLPLGHGHHGPNVGKAIRKPALLLDYLLEQSRLRLVGDFLIGPDITHMLSGSSTGCAVSSGGDLLGLPRSGR